MAEIKRGTALRLGLRPPLGPLLGIITLPDNTSVELREKFKGLLAGRWVVA